MPKKKHNMVGGGALTNEHGLLYEQYTDLEEALKEAGFDLQAHRACQEVFDGLHKVGLVTKKYDFYKIFDHLNNDQWKKYISKRLLPDDVFVNLNTKTVFIIEKKYQMGAGSVDEKLQTVDFKIKEYKKMLPDWEVKFFYILNDFFKQDVYRDVFEYIKSVGGDYYFNTLPLEDLGLDLDDE